MATFELCDRPTGTPWVRLVADDAVSKITEVIALPDDEGGSEEVPKWAYERVSKALEQSDKPTPNGIVALLGSNTGIKKVAEEEDPPEKTVRKTLSDLRKARAENKDEAVEEVDLTEGEISKIDKAQQNVFGWGYVAFDKDGSLNIDKSGDFVDDMDQVEKTAYDFVLKSRAGDSDHTNVQTSTLIESMVFTEEKIEKMGIAPGAVPLGWWVGFHIEDEKVWERVEKGELTAFSIHGKGTREKVDPDTLK
jgi:hypothetical protein